jgi:hypothetical protein
MSNFNPHIDMMPANEFIEEQMRLRMELIERPSFIQMCADYAKSVGITAKEWNENKAGILLLLANEAVGYEQTDLALNCQCEIFVK